MLSELKLCNYIFISDMDLDFDKGLSVFTGETGAGKSIIIDAIKIILGDKLDKSCIQKDKDFCEITACFNNVSREILEKLEIKENEIIIRRRIDTTGKTKSYVNDRLVSVSMIEDISRFLIDIHGQHNHELLFNEDEQRNIIDRFGSIYDELNSFREIFQEKNKLEEDIKKLLNHEEEVKTKADLYNFQIQEINSLETYNGEDEELEKQFLILSNSNKINELFDLVSLNVLEDENSAIERIGRSVKAIEELSKYEDKYVSLLEDLKKTLNVLNEVGFQVSSNKDNIEFDPNKLEQVSIKLQKLDSLKKKYKKSLKEILEYRTFIENELKILSNDSSIRKELEEKLKKIASKVNKEAQNISKLRIEASKKLETLIHRELKDLDMDKVKINVRISDKKNKQDEVCLDETGKDEISFFVKTNIDSDFSPLKEIVSGGELSRIMLAIKSAIAEYDEVPILIFDEIDTGLGGASAFIVGKKLHKLSRKHQVVCITHLAQVAVFGDNHKLVLKKVENNKTNTVINNLNEKNRLEEVGRMLGGNKITNSALENAKELFLLARKEMQFVSVGARV
jgi:DNA repair protein RecN (Recombination protein N)